MGTPDIFRLLSEVPKITVVDVGAMSLGEGSDPYQPLIDAGVANIIGFEPVPEEHAKLQSMARPGRTYLPYAIGDGTKQPFHINNFPMTSSLFRPNHDLTDHFSDLSRLMQVVETVEVETRRMDDIPEVANTDFLKLDIQGAELQVLEGARETLKNVLMVQTEVEFVPLYENQPLFADVDTYLRKAGFLLHQFSHIAGRPFRPLRMKASPGHPGFHQVLWADAIYLRDFRRLGELEPAALLKLAILVHLLCGSFDLVHKYLATHDAKKQTSLAKAYMDLLVKP